MNRDAAAYWIVRSSRTMTSYFDAGDCASSRRPGERRDPYAVSLALGTLADAFRNHEVRGLWVPAFAGTTRGEFQPHPSHHPPCRGVMISISSPFFSGVCAHWLRGSTS
jgi:hypothetical protein